MFILRAILLLLCASVFAFIVVGGLASGRLDGGMMALAGIFFAFLLVLGPFWPSGARAQAIKRSLNKMLGIEDAGPVILVVLLGISAMWNAWSWFTDPMREPHRVERILAAALGRSSVSMFWAIVGVTLLWKGLDLYRKARGNK